MSSDGQRETEKTWESGPGQLGTFLLARRQQLGLSVSEVSQVAHISRAYLHQLEKGEARRPTVPVLLALSQGLQVEFADILQAAGVEATQGISTPQGPDAERRIQLLLSDRELGRLVDVWEVLTDEDRKALLRAARDLARLRGYISSQNEERDSAGI